MQPEPHAEPNRKPAPQCESVQARLFDYLDGDLPVAEMEAIRAHLDACAACRQEEALSRHSEQALTSALSAVPPAGDLRTDFYARLAASNSTASPRPRWAGWHIAVPSLAAALLAAFLVRGALSPSRPLPTTQSKPPHTPRSVRQLSANVFSPEHNAGEQRRGIAPLREAPTPMKIADAPALSEPSLLHVHAPQHPLHLTHVKQALVALRSARTIPAMPKYRIASAGQDYFMYKRGRDAGSALYERLDTFSALAPRAEVASKPAPDAVTRDNLAVFSAKRTLGLQEREASQDSEETPSAPDTVSLHVVDEERGFTATTHLTAVSDNQDDGEQITIEAESIPQTRDATASLARQRSIKSLRGIEQKRNLRP